jgi:hypothetical protein
MTSEAVRAAMLLFMVNHGYDADHRAAVLRQAWLESRWEPCAESYTGHYLFGWVGERLAGLREFVGPGCPSVEAQMEYADRELHQRPFSAFWRERGAAQLRRCFGRGQC